MVVTVNGNEVNVLEGEGVEDLVGRLGFSERRAVVELNGRALFRREWGEVSLEAGDRVEVLEIVAGG